MSQTKDNILQLLRQLEGLPGAKPALHAYRDQAGKLTIGFGHTGCLTFISPCPPITDSTTITEAEAEVLLEHDADTAALAIVGLVRVPLNDNQLGALICFVFNEGIGAFASSTLLRRINDGRFDLAAQEFDKWIYIHVEGKPVISKGLQNRRATEKALFLTPPITEAVIAPQAAQTHGSGPAVPPPQKVTQTVSGKAAIGALATGGAAAVVQGIQQVQPVVAAAQSAMSMTASLPQWLQLASIVAFAASIGFVVWNLWDKHRQIKTGE